VASDLEDLLKDGEKDKTLYAKDLNGAGRRWFTKKILSFVDSQGTTNRKADAKALLKKSATLAKARATPPRGSLIEDLKVLERAIYRTRIVYGIIGSFPAIFLDSTPHNDVLDFILERRFRAIQRMLGFINPNSTRKRVSYPSGGPPTAQVSKDTRTLWVGTTKLPADTTTTPLRFPFVLTAAGKLAPKDAIEKLFTQQKDEADRTRLDCPAAAMATHVDALLAAKDPDKLAKALAAVNAHYLAIDHAYGPQRMIGSRVAGMFTGYVSQLATSGTDVQLHAFGNPAATTFDLVDKDGRMSSLEAKNVTANSPLIAGQVLIESNPMIEWVVTVKNLPRTASVGGHFSEPGLPDFHVVSDPRPDKSLFDQDFIPDTDLQVGDHIYVANHAIHRSRLGNTIWNGEHSFVLYPWAATVGDIAVTGHGVTTKTITQVVATMLEEINIYLDIARKIVDAWLAIPASRAPVVDMDADNNFRNALGVLMLRDSATPYVGKVRPFNMPAFKYKKGGKDTNYAAYWLIELDGTIAAGTPQELTVQRKDVLIFDYNPSRKDADTWPPSPTPRTSGALIARNPSLVALGGPQKTHYGISFIDDLAGMAFLMPLYHPLHPKKGQPVRLGFNDIKNGIGPRPAGGLSKMYVIRPKVRVDTPYLTFLQSIGAIA
jgi:hypothetical protein